MFERDDGGIVDYVRRELALTITGSQQSICDDVGAGLMSEPLPAKDDTD